MIYNLDNFAERKAAALQVLSTCSQINRKSGGFLGNLVADPTPLSEKQLRWMIQLCQRAGVNVEAGE